MIRIIIKVERHVHFTIIQIKRSKEREVIRIIIKVERHVHFTIIQIKRSKERERGDKNYNKGRETCPFHYNTNQEK